MTPEERQEEQLAGPRAITLGCGAGLVMASVVAGLVLGCARARGLEQAHESALAAEMDALVVEAAAAWGFAGLRPYAAVDELPDGVLAATRRGPTAGECHVVFDADAAGWPAAMRWEVALHEVAHCRWALYAVAGGLSEHNPDPASVMASPYRPGGRILASDRAAVRSERVAVGGLAR